MVVRKSTGEVVCERCMLAANPWTRLKGLLGRRELPVGEGLLIRPTWSVHMFFMRFPIDAVFLDGENVVLRVADRLRPWRTASRRGAKAVLELPAGEANSRELAVGDRLVFSE